LAVVNVNYCRAENRRLFNISTKNGKVTLSFFAIFITSSISPKIGLVPKVNAEYFRELHNHVVLLAE